MKKQYNNKARSGLSVVVDRDFNKALRIFSKKVQDSGLLKEVKDRMHYEPPSVKKQRKRKVARKRWLKKVEQMKLGGTGLGD